MSMLRRVLVFLLLLALLLITIQAASAAVVINEFMANAAGAGTDPAREWIELYNNGTNTVDLTGYKLSDEEGTFTFGAVTLSAGGFLVLVNNRTEFNTVHSLPSSTQAIEYGVAAPNLELSDAGDGLFLNDSISVVDNATYTSTNDGKTIGRETDGIGSFVELTQATPGKANRLPDITLPSTLEFGEVDRNTEVKKTFTLSNGGTRSVENVVVSAGQNSFNLTFSKDGVNFFPQLSVGSIAVQQAVTLTARINVPNDADSGKKDFADVTVSATDVTKTISDVSVNPKSMLSIKKAKVGGDTLTDGGSADIKPGESVEIEITAENLFTADVQIENVEIDVTIFDIDDGDDIDETSDEFDIDTDDTKKETISVNIPELLDDESYKILIEAEGTDENGARHKATLEGKLDSDKKKHELKLEARIFPTEISCSRTPTLTARVVNLGKEDEEDVVVTVNSVELGISEESTAADVDEAEDHSASFNLNLNGARLGTYTLEVKAFRDEDDLEATETVSVTVKECQEVQSRVTDITEQQIGQQQQELINRLLAQQQQQPPSVSVSERDDGMLWVALAIVIVINLGLLVFVVGAFFVKKKKRLPEKGGSRGG